MIILSIETNEIGSEVFLGSLFALRGFRPTLSPLCIKRRRQKTKAAFGAVCDAGALERVCCASRASPQSRVCASGT